MSKLFYEDHDREEIARQWEERRGDNFRGEIIRPGEIRADVSGVSAGVDDYFNQIMDYVHRMYYQSPTFPPVDMTPDEESLQSYYHAMGRHAEDGDGGNTPGRDGRGYSPRKRHRWESG